MPVIAPAYSTWMLNSLNIEVARFRKALSRWNTAILYFLPFPRHDLAKRCRGTSVWQPCSWAVVDNGALKRVRCRGMPLSRHFRGTCLDRAQRGVEKWQLSLTISGCRNIHSMHQAAAHSVMTWNVNLSGMAICLAGLRGGVAHALRASRKGSWTYRCGLQRLLLHISIPVDCAPCSFE